MMVSALRSILGSGITTRCLTQLSLFDLLGDVHVKVP